MAGPIAILGGTGALGSGLALRWSRAGLSVVIGSRDAGRARDAAAPLGLEGDENAAAAARADVAVLTVPFASQAKTIQSVADQLREGALFVDCTVPLATAVGGRPSHALGVWAGSAAQQAAALLPGHVRVVSALHSVSAELLGTPDHELHEDVLVCGDRKADKREIAELIERIPGLRAVDAGRLEMARYCEQLTPLLIGINVRHKARTGIRIEGLPDDRWS